MKKFYSIFVLAVLALAGLTANATNVTFILSGEGSLLIGTDNGTSFDFTQTANQGETTFDLESYTNWYFEPAEGYEVVSFYDRGLSELKNPLASNLAHGLTDVYNQFVGRAAKTFEVELKAVGGGNEDPDPIVNPDEIKVTFKVGEEGGADLYQYDTTTQAYSFFQALPAGEETEVTLSKKTYYNVVAAEGMELVSVLDANNQALDLKTSKDYTTNYVVIDGATATESYTVTAAPEKPKTIPVVFNLTAGSKASLYLDDFFNDELTLVKALEDGENTVELTPGNTYALVAGEGLVFKSIINANGNEVTSYPYDEYYGGAFATIQADNASASYTITTEEEQTVPVTEGVKFTLAEGSKAVLYTANDDELVPAEELGEGETVLNLDFNTNLYYILPAEGYRLVSVVTAEGTEVELLEDPEFFATNAAFLNEDQSASYTITTEEVSGISTINATDNATEQWFDLQGRRVERPAAGLYIVRRAGLTTKVIVK